MAKPWRMVTLHIGAWTALLFLSRGSADHRAGGLTILDWTCLIIIAGCVQTVGVRLRRIMLALKAKSKA